MPATTTARIIQTRTDNITFDSALLFILIFPHRYYYLCYNHNKRSQWTYQLSSAQLFSFDQSLSEWDVSSVTYISGMFYGAISFDQSLSDWDVSSVTDMSYMFYEASSFDQSLSEWDVSSVTDMSSMFEGASSFNQRLCAWGKNGFPFEDASEIFTDSGCTYKDTPTSEDNAFCAGSTEECTAYNRPTASPATVAAAATNTPTKTPTKLPTNSPSKLPTGDTPTHLPTKTSTDSPTQQWEWLLTMPMVPLALLCLDSLVLALSLVLLLHS